MVIKNTVIEVFVTRKHKIIFLSYENKYKLLDMILETKVKTSGFESLINTPESAFSNDLRVQTCILTPNVITPI